MTCRRGSGALSKLLKDVPKAFGSTSKISEEQPKGSGRSLKISEGRLKEAESSPQTFGGRKKEDGRYERPNAEEAEENIFIEISPIEMPVKSKRFVTFAP